MQLLPHAAAAFARDWLAGFAQSVITLCCFNTSGYI